MLRRLLAFVLCGSVAAEAGADELPDAYDLRDGLRWVAKSHSPPLYLHADDRRVAALVDALRTNTPGLKLRVGEPPGVDGCALAVRWDAPRWVLTGSGTCPGEWQSSDWAPQPTPDAPLEVGRIMGAAALGQLAGLTAGTLTTALVCGPGQLCGGDGGAWFLVAVSCLSVGNTVGGVTGAAIGGGRSYGWAAGLGATGVTATGFGLLGVHHEVAGVAGLSLFALGPTLGAGLGPLVGRLPRARPRSR